MFQFRGRMVFFATNNINKFNEARMVFTSYGIAVGMLRVKTLEIQNDDLEEIAKSSVTEAFRRCNLPVIVEDAGLFVKALNGFPGPYSAYVYKTIGNRGLLRLMQSVEERAAKFRSVIAFQSSELRVPACFDGEIRGEITRNERRNNANSGFGFDPVFKPTRSNKTFAEMTIAEKNKRSHRAMALRKFAEWYRRER